MSVDQLKTIASHLVAFCKENQTVQCLNALYADDAVSVEAMAMPGSDSAEAVGRDAILGKHDWWNKTMEVHSGSIDGPYFHGTDRFSVIFELDVTNKETGERSDMKEVAIYTIKGDKIVREEFYYQI